MQILGNEYAEENNNQDRHFFTNSFYFDSVFLQL